MRGCGGAAAQPGRGPSGAGGRAAWQRAGSSLRPEARGRPPLRPAPSGALAAQTGQLSLECALRAVLRAGVHRTRSRALRRGGACAGPPGAGTVEPPRPAASGKGGVTAVPNTVPAAAPAEKLLLSRPASVCRGGGGWAGARLLLREGRGPLVRPQLAHLLYLLLTH